MNKRFVVIGLAAVSAPLLVAVGCSTSNVHPPTFGDCENPATCTTPAPVRPEAGAAANDAAVSTAIERSTVSGCSVIPNREVTGISASEGNAWIEGTVTFRSYDEYGVDGGLRAVFVTYFGDAGPPVTTALDVDNEPPRQAGVGFKLAYTYRIAGLRVGTYKIGAQVAPPNVVGQGYWTTAGTVKTAAEAELLEVRDDKECIKNVRVTAEKVGPKDAGTDGDAGPSDGGAG